VKYLIGLIFLLFSSATLASVDTSRFVQLIDYIGVDYPGAVENGQIISAAEYEEMQEFSATVLQHARQLAAQAPSADLVPAATQLQALIARRANADKIAQITSMLRQTTLQHFNIVVIPRSAPNLQHGQILYAQNCSGCHGETGAGNGPMAVGQDPAPTNFRDLARYRERTLYGLFSTIGLGVKGTAMQSYAANLNEHERWSLAFYVGQLTAKPEVQNKGAKLWAASAASSPFAQVETLTTVTPAEAEQRYGADGVLLMSYLRTNPGVLFGKKPPLVIAQESIVESRRAYTDGDQPAAYRHALAAYLDGFELIEHSLDANDRDLRLQVEVAMTAYRELVKKTGNHDAVQKQAQIVLALLDRTDEVLKSTTLSNSAAFSGSFIILLREGLEAILVIVALAAFLVKTGRRDGLVYLHFGWAGALLMGAATWLVSQYLIDFSGASREITEGIAALIAMAVLFYVGFWLHSKTNAQQWKHFIEGSMTKALNTGTMWTIAGLSFIAVYREVFETILFYQAMWMQAERNAQGFMLAGMGSAAVALFLLAWVILRYSARLPLRQFFSFTSVFMFVLAIVFAGKGVAALQEAGKLSVEPVNFPRIDILGIYPNMQGLMLQLGLLVLAAIIVVRINRKSLSTENSEISVTEKL